LQSSLGREISSNCRSGNFSLGWSWLN